MSKNLFKTAAGLALALFIGFMGTVHAAFPDKPITIIVPYSPGGMSDLTARVVSQGLSAQIGQSVAVVNRVGGGGAQGTHELTRSKDGYTLAVVPPPMIFPEIYRPDVTSMFTSKDIIPVCRVAINITPIVIGKDIPANTLAEFIEYAKKNPGLRYGHSGRGNTTHVIGVDIARLTGIKIQDVPYSSDATVATAILGKQIPFGFPTMPAVLSHIRAGSVKCLAVHLPKRDPDVPDVPTFSEAGLNLEVPQSFNTLIASKNTPPEQIAFLRQAMGRAYKDPNYVAMVRKIGAYPGYLSDEELKEELAKFEENARRFINLIR